MNTIRNFAMTHPWAILAGRLLAALLAGVLALALFGTPSANAASRIKDIAEFEGIRENMLVGYGLVVGLDGTGDDLDDAPFTQQSLIGMLERLGVNTRDNLANLDTENVAAVMVTATLPPFARQGSRIDIAVSALGSAESLLGGTLLVTPLLGVDFELASLKSVKIALRNPDLTTARRIARAINANLGQPTSRAIDPGTVLLSIPDGYSDDLVGLLTEIEQLPVQPDQVARVVIDEQSGIIVMGENVRISTVAIAQGNLTIRITETPQVSQPEPFSEGGNTEVVPRTDIEVDEEEDRRLGVLQTGVTLQELVNGLNALGIGPRDMIGILQAIKTAGALHADIEVR